MINLIGAYIISIFLIGLVAKRPDFQAFENSLQELQRYKRIALSVFLALLLPACFELGTSISLLTPFNFFSMLFSGFNFWIHEAGHIYFSWGGEMLHSFGGTLNELLFPLVLLFFARRSQRTNSFWLAVYWVGFNCIGIGRYMADARARVLPLAGGGTHDWFILFGKFDLLSYDATIGGVTRTLGVCLALLSVGRLFLISKAPGSVRDSKRNSLKNEDQG